MLNACYWMLLQLSGDNVEIDTMFSRYNFMLFRADESKQCRKHD